MIYALQPIIGGPVKIGTTENLTARVAQLEAHYGLPLAVLATFPGGRQEEAEVHRRFAHLRFGRTEQFRPEPDLMAFLGRPLLVGANPKAVRAMPGRAPKPGATTLSFSLPTGYKDWLAAFATHERANMSDLLDDAIVAYAQAKSFKSPAPRRCDPAG